MIDIKFVDVDPISNVVTVIVTETFDDLVERIIPIYTIKNPDPKTGREDCRLTTHMKQQRRFSMKNRLIEAGGDQDKIKAIIERYARTEQ